MALWDGTSFNTNTASNLFNRIMSKDTVPMAVKGNAFLYYMMGKTDMGEYVASGLPSLKRVSTITGNNVEFSLLGSVAAPGYIADGSAEVATVSLSHVSNITGSVEFALAKLGLTHPVPDHEFDRFAGNEMKTVSWMKTLGTYLSEGYANVMSTALHSSTTSDIPARSKFAGWQAAVDDANTYGLNRGDVTNVDFTSKVVASFGAFDWDTIMSHVFLQATTYNAKVRLAVMHPTVYAAAMRYANSMSLITNPGDAVAFGATTATLSGIKLIADQKCTATTIGLFDPDWWELVWNETRPFTSADRFLVNDPSRVATRVIQSSLWAQNLCRKPSNQIKITGVTV